MHFAKSKCSLALKRCIETIPQHEPITDHETYSKKQNTRNDQQLAQPDKEPSNIELPNESMDDNHFESTDEQSEDTMNDEISYDYNSVFIPEHDTESPQIPSVLTARNDYQESNHNETSSLQSPTSHSFSNETTATETLMADLSLISTSGGQNT
jgi:hypothetical protein